MNNMGTLLSGAELMADLIIDLTDGDFNEFINSKRKIIVEFWDPWCSICTEMAPFYMILSEKYGSEVKFGKLNMRENKQLPDKFGVYVTPTFIFFKDGKEVERLGGLIEYNQLDIEIEKFNQ